MLPFFSICIPATGRSKTIERALNSIINQEFKIFEIIVTTRKDQITYEIVNSFIKNNQLNVPIYNIHINEDRIDCNDWNDSIKFATGKFIAVLEGDDYFYKDYLKKAYEIINEYKFDVCLFATTNRDNKPSPFLMNKIDFFNFIYSLKAVPAPSESIFPRVCNNESIQYDIESYKYAPEIDLNLRLTSHISNFVRLENVGVYREVSSDPNNRISLLYYRDQIIVLFKFFRGNNIFIFFRGVFNLFYIYLKSFIIYIISRI
jgi:glycosyltransferase involved in cell wall biosynthesis